MGNFKKTNFKKTVGKNVEKQNAEGSNYGYLQLPKGVQMFKEHEGKITLDFMPYIVKSDKHPDRDPELDIATPKSLWYKLPFKVHKSIGSNNEALVCPTTFGKPCPICEYRRKRASEGAEKEELQALNASKRNLYVVIPIGDKKLEEKPMIWDVSDFLFQQLLNEELGDNEDYLAFPDLEDGYSLRIRFEEDSFNKQKFYKANRIDFVKREEAYDEDILDEIPCLDNLLTLKTYKEIQAIFLEEDIIDSNEEDIEELDEGSDEEEDEKPIKHRSKKSADKPTKKKHVKEEDDEDDEDDNEDDEDDNEDDEPPMRRNTTKKLAKEEDDEEDDSDEDADEDDSDEDDSDKNDEDDEDDEEKPKLKLPKNLIKLINWRVSYKEFEGHVCAVTPDERTCTIKNDAGKTKVGIPVSKLTLIKEYVKKTGPRPGKESPKTKVPSATERDKGRSPKCPHGYPFGEADEHGEHCEDCPIWSACLDAQEKASKKK